MPNANAPVSRRSLAAATVRPTLTRVGFPPIVRVDAERREVELCATSEAVDSYNTVFDYVASQDVFSRWIGNVREIHVRRALGTRVGVRFDDAVRRIYVRVRISRGAEDTWEKIQDGTLRGASIGASNVTSRRQRRPLADGEGALEVATAYALAELSLVDNPANPDALGANIVRGAVPDLAQLDALDTTETSAEADTNRHPASFPECPVKDAGHSPRVSDALSREDRGAASALETHTGRDTAHSWESLAGRLAEPQAQITVAAELIRLQQG